MMIPTRDCLMTPVTNCLKILTRAVGGLGNVKEEGPLSTGSALFLLVMMMKTMLFNPLEKLAF